MKILPEVIRRPGAAALVSRCLKSVREEDRCCSAITMKPIMASSLRHPQALERALQARARHPFGDGEGVSARSLHEA
jgi:hypothetical protein